MAKCERCGASFDYEERQGVCPRCCFYNRPPGAARQDTEWMKYYNVEDNSYQLPKSEGLADLFPEERSSWTRRIRSGHREKETSRNSRRDSVARRQEEARQEASRRNSGRFRQTDADSRRRTAARTYAEPESNGRKPVVGKVISFVVIICILLVIVTAVLQVASDRGFKLSSGEGDQRDKTMLIESISAQEAAQGVTAGDLTYYVGEARTLFNEGELSDLPAGEKCIGIWLEDDESSLDYTGYDWERPYVFDGTNFREMVDVGALDDQHYFTERGIETASVYGVGYEDMNGYGVFFVDAAAQSVTLSLPCQTVDENDTDVAEYSEVIDIVIPLSQ